jgi:hypothetical protein
MASLFDTLQANAFRSGVQARTKASRKWFEKNVEKLKMPSRNALLKDSALDPVSKQIAGNMYMYFYDPKHKKTLPYYDRFPLTIMLQPVKGGFQGLNLHYLQPDIRAKFLDELMKLAPSKVKNNSRLTKLRYDLLQSTRKYKEFKPCFKTYLTSQVASRMVRVPMTEWEVAVFLPTEQFKKSGKQNVWKDSLKIARKS